MAANRQIDIANDKAKDAAAFSIVVICIIFFAFLIWARPGITGWDSMIRGGISEFAVIFGLCIFSLYGITLALRLAKFGAVVSIGEEGIFDRRLSTDWIPWSAILDINIIEGKARQGLIFRLNQNQNAVLPLRRNAVEVLRTSTTRAPSEFWVAADNLKGGFGALFTAVDRFRRQNNKPSNTRVVSFFRSV